MKQKQPKNLIPFLSFILSLFTLNAVAQQSTRGNIHGQIITLEHKPAENVNVVLKDTRFGTLSDENGNYSFRVPTGTYTIVISHIGAKNQEKQITVQAGQTTKVQPLVFNISATSLHEIVVSDNKANKFVKKQSDYVAKMPLKNLENPQVYTTISKELLTEQINTNFNDALRNASGLDKLWTSTGRAGDGAAYYSLRGFTIQPTMVNGIAGLTNGDLDPANIERIEVIKGPSGALFGGALTNFGGLINIVTKRPIDTIGGQIGYSAGNFSLSRLNADIYGPISKDKKLLGRVNATYSYQNSFQDAGFRRSLFIAPSLEYRASDKFKLNLDAEFYNYEGSNPLSVFLNRSRQLIARTPDELNFDWNRSYTSNDITIRTPTSNIRGLATYKISDQWTSQTSFSSSNRKTDGYNQYIMYIGASDTLLNRYASMQNSTSTVVDIQQNFNGDFKIGEMRNRVLVGLDFLNQTTNNDNSPYILFDQVNSSRNDPRYVGLNATTLYARLGASTAAYTKNQTVSNVYSIYAADVLNITDQLLATASLRLDRFDNKGTYTLSTNLTTGSYTQNALSPKFGLVYQVVKDQLSIFGNYMNGFRNVSPVTQPLTDISGIFKPQQANQIEGGIKADVFNNRLTFTASYYDISVDNMTRSESVVRAGQTYNITVQDGTQKSKGFELDLIANPVNGLNIIAGYSHNDSKMTQSAAAVLGRRPVSAGPADLANAWISYTQPTGKFTGLGVGFGGNYAGKNVIANDANIGEFTLPAYTVLNSTIFYSTKQYRLGLKVDNLTDKLYYKGWTTVEPQMPRSIVANVTFKF
jgi:iron complex outermembrane receptor protein